MEEEKEESKVFDANKLIAYRFEFEGGGVILALAEDTKTAATNAVRAIVACGKEDFDGDYLQELIDTMRLAWEKPLSTLSAENRTLILRGSMV